MSRVEPLVLRAGDEQVLREWVRSSTISAGLAQRARILLLASEGNSNAEVARLVGVSLPTVRSWRSRYTSGGLAGGCRHARHGGHHFPPRQQRRRRRRARRAGHHRGHIGSASPPASPVARCRSTFRCAPSVAGDRATLPHRRVRGSRRGRPSVRRCERGDSPSRQLHPGLASGQVCRRRRRCRRAWRR